MRVLITGASGFAGGYLARACAEAGDEVIGVTRSSGKPLDEIELHHVDLRDAERTRALVAEVGPDVVYHLAALSSVGRSWEEPAQTVEDNVASAVSVLESLRLEAPAARTVWVSSCEVYGPRQQLPISEDAPLAPANPYAVSKSAGDLLAGVYADAYGLEIIRARPFNHAGPGQLPLFILSNFARQVAEQLAAGAERVRVVSGNPETRRDFTDVRDVVRAYRLLAERATPGVYNVCSGHSISAAEQVRALGELIAPVEIEQYVDPARVRANEVMDLCGANERIADATGWRPEIPFSQMMLDTLHWWQRELAVAT